MTARRISRTARAVTAVLVLAGSLIGLANPARGQTRDIHNELHGIDCYTSHACLAVGVRTGGRALVEYWTGDRFDGFFWYLQSVAYTLTGTVLEDVSCSAGGPCLAVGTHTTADGVAHPLVLDHATGWGRMTPPPVPPNTRLTRIACGSATCFVVAVTPNADPSLPDVTRIVMWSSGTGWSAATLPPSGYTEVIHDIDCGPAFPGCTAVGYRIVDGTNRPIARQWDGTAWGPSTLVSAQTGYLRSVSCGGQTSIGCAAVGVDSDTTNPTRPLIVRHNGTGWHTDIAPTDSPSASLTRVACAYRACRAVGAPDVHDPTVTSYQLSYSASSGNWYDQAPAPRTNPYQILAVSCSLSDRCIEVGWMHATESDGSTASFAIANGCCWGRMTVPNPG